jgi:DNA-binding response OmpR family regulator
MTLILVVEDEERISSFLAHGLESAGFTVQVAPTYREGLHIALDGVAQLIILDIGLPDGDGMQLLKEVRKHHITTPVIVLTARSSVDDRVAGLEGGADDYIPKPFHFAELLARVRVRLRVAETEAPTGNQALSLEAGNLKLDLLTRQATIDARVIDLSAREFTMAETLLRHQGRVLSREQLLDQVWGYDHDPGSNIVEVYIAYLRQKLGKDRIETVRGMGYRLKAL